MTRRIPARPAFAVALLPLTIAGCATGGTPAAEPGAPSMSLDTAPIASREGFTGPEAVRYDADQDVYFVSNFGEGPSSARDNNGFISRMSPDGVVQQLRFIAGGAAGVTLHAPRGMTIVGDTLWVADADAVRGFDRRTGAPLASVDFSASDVGFLNDVAADATGAVYVTDTGRNRIYAVRGGPRVALADSALGSPNGITWDGANARFLVVPYGGATAIRSWTPGSNQLSDVGTGPGGRYDGVEVLADGRVLVASQADTSLHLFTGGVGRRIINTTGAPADIAVDTRRRRVAVPYIRLNRVDIWELPIP